MMQTIAGSTPLVEGQQSYDITFSPPFGVAPSSFLPSIFIPNSSGEIVAVCADVSTLTATGVTVWLNAIPTSASAGGFINWRAANLPVGYPTPSGELAGSIVLVGGLQSYQITFPVPFAGTPQTFLCSVQMPNSSGEIFTASPDLSTLSPSGVTVWLGGVPTPASAAGFLNWYAKGTPALSASPTVAQSGRKSLVAGQQSYIINFPTSFVGRPTAFFPTVFMPNSSGEVLEASVDYSTLTSTGVVVWLNGLPTDASTGGYIDWMTQGVPQTSTQQRGMTVLQLFHRIGRRARNGGDFTKLDMSEQTDLAEAANTGLQKVYNALPTYFKDQTQGFALPGPLAITGVNVVQYSPTVSPLTFTKAQLGCTVRLDGDGQWNQIIGPETLLNPYMGDTAVVGGTIYGDALHSDTYPLDRIIGNPQFPNQGAGFTINPMVGLSNYGNGYGAWLWQRSIGVPCMWWIQTMGQSQGQAPFVILKFAPLPNRAYPVSIRMSFWPKRLTLADYQAATPIVVPEQFIEAALIPLCLEAFMTSPAWQQRGDEDRIWQNARDAEAYLRLQSPQVGTPRTRVFTPYGF